MNTPNSVEPPMPLAIGDVVDSRYTVESVLGRGGYGVVFKARQASTDQMVALKVLHAGGDGQGQPEHQDARFEREMRLIGQINHPNIVRLIDFGRLPSGLLYTVMEHVDGRSLSEVIRAEGGLRPSEAKHFMVQVANALSAAHELGIVYRDLKPANIMITRSGHRRNVVLLDFGISALVEEARYEGYKELTANGHIHGTPAYMAPEQLRSGPLTPQTDIYAWGLVFLECLTGSRVVTGDTFVEVIVKQLHDDVVSLPEELLRSPCSGILQRAICKKLDGRYPDVGELIDDMEACAIPSSLVLPWTGKKAVEAIQRTAQRRPTHSLSGSNSWSGEFSVDLEKMINSESVEIRSMLDDLDDETKPPQPSDPGVGLGLLFGAVAAFLVIGGLGLVLWYVLTTGQQTQPPSAPTTTATVTQTAAVPATPSGPSGPTEYRVKLSATPAGATITLDGVNVGAGAYATKLPVDGKEHRVLVEADGYQPYRATFLDTPPHETIELKPIEASPGPAAEVVERSDPRPVRRTRPRSSRSTPTTPSPEVAPAESPAAIESPAKAAEPVKVKKKKRRAKKGDDWGEGLGSIDTPDPWD